MKSFIFLMILTVSGSAFADTNSVTEFFTAAGGHWTGRGTVIMQGLGRSPAKYNISTDVQVAPTGQAAWSLATTMAGMPGAGNTTTTVYKIDSGGLVVTSTQYVQYAQISASTPLQLSLSTDHTDPNTGNDVVTSRQMTLVGLDSMHITSNIYQNKVLVEHFDYSLQRH